MDVRPIGFIYLLSMEKLCDLVLLLDVVIGMFY